MLTTGTKAPSFKGKDQHGNTISLSDFKGNPLVIYFYPQDNTPTCTVQACNLRDHFGLLRNQGFQIIGVSPDKIESHKKFADKFELPFSIIADPEKKIIDAFGVWGEKNMYGKKYMGLLRTTYVIDKKGIIQHVISKPKAKLHAEEIMELGKNLI